MSECFCSLQRGLFLLSPSFSPLSFLFNFSSFHEFLTTNVNFSHHTLRQFPLSTTAHARLFVCYPHWPNWSGCAHAAVRPSRRASAQPHAHGHGQKKLKRINCSTLTMAPLKCQKLIYRMAKKGFCLFISYQKYVIILLSTI